MVSILEKIKVQKWPESPMKSVSSQEAKIASRGEAGWPGKGTSIAKAETGLEKRLC